MRQQYTKVMENIMILTNYERKKFELDFIGTEHILLALANEDGPAKELLQNQNATYDKIREKVIEFHKKDLEDQKEDDNISLYREYTEDCKKLVSIDEFYESKNTAEMLYHLLTVEESRAKDILLSLKVNVQDLIKSLDVDQ